MRAVANPQFSSFAPERTGLRGILPHTFCPNFRTDGHFPTFRRAQYLDGLNRIIAGHQSL